MVDGSTSKSWKTVYKISRSWLDVLIFMSLYLEPCVWPDGMSRWMDPTKEQRQILCKSRKKCDQKQHDCRSHPPYFSRFHRLKIKLKGRHFDTIEVIEAESQAVLYILTEHNLRDAFKKIAHTRVRGLHRG
jgi:hypothetical protein